MIDGTYLFGFNYVKFIQHVVNYSIVLLFFLKPFLGIELLPRLFVCWAAAYLVPNLPKTLNSLEKITRPWIIQILGALFKQSTYRLRRFTALSYFAGRVFDEAVSPILFLLSPVRLASAGYFLIRRCYHTFVNTSSYFNTIKNIYILLKRNGITIKTLYIPLF